MAGQGEIRIGCVVL